MYEVLIEKKKIILNEAAQQILETFRHALNQSSIKISDDLMVSLQLKTTEPQLDKGLLSKALSFGETLFEKSFGAHFSELSPFRAKLDPISFNIYEEYRNYLISCLGKDSLFSFVDHYEIKNGILLIQELFIRLVVQALRSDASAENQRHTFIEVLGLFSDGLFKNSFFLNDSSCTAFKIALSKEHKNWVVGLKEIVEFVKNLNKPEEVISSNLNVLKLCERKIMRHLIFILAGNQVSKNHWEGKLSERCLANTLSSFESDILIKYDSNNIQDEKKDLKVTQNLAFNQKLLQVGFLTLEEILKQDQICNNPSFIGNSYLKNLYELLNKTKLIIKLIERIALLTKISGWLPFLFNFINLQAIDKILKDYHHLCDTVLSLSQANEPKVLKTSFGNELLFHEASIAYRNLQEISKLSSLQDAKLLKRIENYIAEDIFQLSKLSELLECNIISDNLEAANNLVFSDSYENSLFKTYPVLAQNKKEKVLFIKNSELNKDHSIPSSQNDIYNESKRLSRLNLKIDDLSENIEKFKERLDKLTIEDFYKK